MHLSTRFLLVVSLLAGGCGKHSSPAASSPTATVEGRVMGPNAKALRIDVPGSSASTTTDPRGGFVLLQVPAGASALRFRGDGIDASLAIASLRPREHRRLSVSISRGRASEMHESTETEFSGKVVAVTPPSLQVEDLTVLTDSSTAIDKEGKSIGLDAVQAGDFVEVEGSLQADGTVLARKISVEQADDQGDTVHFEGPLTAIDGMHLTVGVLPVEVTADTIILRGDKPIALGDLNLGDQLAVLATLDAQKGIVALEIRVLLQEEELKLFGFIAAIDGGAKTITVGDVVLQFDDQTQVSGAGDPKSVADLHEGDLVDVEGVHRSDDSFYASSIERLRPPPPPGEFDFTGTIDALDASGLTVSGKRFAVDANTVIRRNGATISLGDLQVGEQVEVQALPQTDAPPLAKLITAY